MAAYELTSRNLELSPIPLLNSALATVKSCSTDERKLLDRNQADNFGLEDSKAQNDRTHSTYPNIGSHTQLPISLNQIDFPGTPNILQNAQENKLEKKTCYLVTCDCKNRVEVSPHDNTELCDQFLEPSSLPGETRFATNQTSHTSESNSNIGLAGLSPANNSSVSQCDAVSISSIHFNVGATCSYTTQKGLNYPFINNADSLASPESFQPPSRHEYDSTSENIRGLSQTPQDKDENSIIGQHASNATTLNSQDQEFIQISNCQVNCDLNNVISILNEQQLDQKIIRNQIYSENPPINEDHVSHQTMPTQLIHSGVDSCSSKNQNQKKEMYIIKKISWIDASANQKPRVSPILIQNSNGPCPLLALVNALTLSTPANVNTPLVDTLRSREQVSLGLLLDAIFDELTSERHSNTSNELPDVTDLYSFLVTLHMGMNVNPCFFPRATSEVNEKSGPHDSHLKCRNPIAGSFEKTREMRLYSTFDISLIHGWLPEPSSPESAALFRSARTYEDAQNIMLVQEALETKLSEESLDSKEQILLNDISTIRTFFALNPTQLTPCGLDAIKSSLAPGTVAIFFRNNHFSTIYRQPKNLQLLQLVTDIGYAESDKVVWESLMDVTGENSQFYSGDFQLVSGNPSTLFNTLISAGNIASQKPGLQLDKDPSLSSINESKHIQFSEQEDQDLALALLLQEEEEQKHLSLDQRYRGTEISQLKTVQSSQRCKRINDTAGEPATATSSRRGSGNRPAIPPRRSTMNLANRPDIRPGEAVVEAATESPPPYEVAATQQPYLPQDGRSYPSTSSDQPYRRSLSSRADQNRKSGTRSRHNDQSPISDTGMRAVRRLTSSQATRNKFFNLKERGQRKCALM